ncbi:MAG: PH domain-containing protein [Lachnospiraceae bacterium]|jgi:thymidylate kinase|nr:PH domain-containing protein [Lachnospiraceae bacterium]
MKSYRSKIGRVYFVMTIVFTALIVLSITAAFAGATLTAEKITLVCAFVAAMFGLFFATIFPMLNTRYVIVEDRLIITSGFYKKTIALSQITEIYEKKSFGREPALSATRLYLKYVSGPEKGGVGISPQNQADFLKSINKESN